MTAEQASSALKIHVVIPCFKVSNHILAVLSRVGPEVEHIWVVDDRCPELTGDIVERDSTDSRVAVLRNPMNLGVGGATKVGIAAAMTAGADIIVKLDGDGQMNPACIGLLTAPIVSGIADYAKGNRFNSPKSLREMPKVRIVGNAILSFWSKIATGYWSINDPTNGFLAINREVALKIEFEKIANSYFFESDLLYRLRLANARVADVSMSAKYGDETSSLSISRTILTFPFLFSRNYLGRVVYQYYLREWSIASLELPLGWAAIFCGSWLGISSLLQAYTSYSSITAGQATAASLLVILGMQLVLSFLSYDIASEPRARK